MTFEKRYYKNKFLERIILFTTSLANLHLINKTCFFKPHIFCVRLDQPQSNIFSTITDSIHNQKIEDLQFAELLIESNSVSINF